MSTPILATKLYLPPLRPYLVRRTQLIEKLNRGLNGKLTLISAPAGFGKTTLVAEWIATCTQPVAWLSLDEDDSDPMRFLAYLVAALQTIEPNLGSGVLGLLQSPQPPPIEAILTALLNDLATLSEHCLLVLDDYHLLDTGGPLGAIDRALTFLLDHLPPQLQLLITTREDPNLPLARYRARGQLTEVRASDLRFTLTESAAFLNDMMGLELRSDEIDILEARTEGWIAGLQLAAVSMQGQEAGQQKRSNFIQSFGGSHRFVMDYIVEEVLEQQPAEVQHFLLCTSILSRLCGPLCDALLGNSPNDAIPDGTASGQTMLEALDQANLFLVPLDNERRWFRYHHLFAELLRQRLQQQIAEVGKGAATVAELHLRASVWFEASGFEVEAFHHATAANDVARAERLIEGKGTPLHFRGVVAPILKWLKTLPTAVLDTHPMLWTVYASTLLVSGQPTRVETTLQAAETALQNSGPPDTVDTKSRDLVGRIAAIRATLAAGQRKVDAIIEESRRALQYLHKENRAFRTSTAWKLGYAYYLQGDRAAAAQSYTAVIADGETSDHTIFTTLATVGLAVIQESELQLDLAIESYQRALQLFGDPPLPDACEVHLGLARIYYARNDLVAAHAHAEQSVELVKRREQNDRTVVIETFLARLQLAKGDVSGAVARLTQAEQVARQRGLEQCIPAIVAVQVLTLLYQKNLAAAAQLVQPHDLPCSQARVQLAQGNAVAALATLEPMYHDMKTKGWVDKLLNVLLLQALAYHHSGATKEAMQRLGEALTLAEPGVIIRPFIDEGAPAASLLARYATTPTTQAVTADYVNKLLSTFNRVDQPWTDRDNPSTTAPPTFASAQPLIEPLTERELEVLALIAQGLSNREISERLFLALDTVKGHNRRIFGKLEVKRRTEAVAKARALGLLASHQEVER